MQLLLIITLVYAPSARQVHEQTVQMPVGATVADALEVAKSREGWPEIPVNAGIGIWGQAANLTQRLTTNDRVEIYRPLLVDPKVARRLRFAKQGSKQAGLFAKRRTGGKAGY